MAERRNWTWWGEISGAFGDLGITLPLAFALTLSSGMPAARLFFLWGLVYIGSGMFFRVPMSVQPLKAMAVIAIGLGLDANVLSTAAVGYGLLFVLLASSGRVEKLQTWFSPALIRGIQLGIGVILVRKAVDLVAGQGWFLGDTHATGWIGLAVAAGTILFLAFVQRKWRRNFALPVILVSISGGVLLAGLGEIVPASSPVAWQLPDWQAWPSLFVLLMLPQLPLTLGNAVIAADDASHHYFPDRSRRVSLRSLASSIGLANIGIGLLGGFPICHGAGGIAAHARFGARTQRSTILLGSFFVLIALVPTAGAVLLRLPVPVLGALLALVGIELILLIRSLGTRGELIVAISVAAVSVLTRNLAWGLASGGLVQLLISRGGFRGSYHRNLHQPEKGHGQITSPAGNTAH